MRLQAEKLEKERLEMSGNGHLAWKLNRGATDLSEYQQNFYIPSSNEATLDDQYQLDHNQINPQSELNYNQVCCDSKTL